MIWIELIGPSGIGKSYWYQRFINEYPEYDITDIVLKRIKNSASYEKNELKIRILFIVAYLNIPKISKIAKQELIKIFMKRFQDQKKEVYSPGALSDINRYIEETTLLDEPSINILKRIEYFSVKLTELEFYKYYLRDNDVYIAEDGIAHLSPVVLLNIMPDLYVIFEKNDEDVIKQRIQRSIKGPTTYMEKLLEPDKLYKYMISYMSSYKIKINSLNSLVSKNRVFIINIQDDDNYKKLLTRIAQIEKYKPKNR